MSVPADLKRSALPLRRRIIDRLTSSLMLVALLLAVIPLAMVIYIVIAKGASIMSWDFVTGDRIPRQEDTPGGSMGPAVVGTLIITGAAAALSVPLGVLGAIYLNEYGKQSRLARFIRTMADVMTGVPSIVMGLFILVVWVLVVKEKTGFAASMALACLMLPVVVRSSEEMLKLVPDELRQASAALGARKWRTTITVVLPAAISGITSGAMLAIARAAGETAPIIVVAGLVTRTNWDLFHGENTALTAQIFKYATSPFAEAQERAWGAALTLMAIVLIFTIISRVVAGRFAIKER